MQRGSSLSESLSLYSVTRVIRDCGQISRVKIASLLRSNPSSVGRAVDALLRTGVIHEVGQRISGAGRPSILLEMNYDVSAVLTVDLRLTEAYAAITDLDGKILTHRTRPLSQEDPQQSVKDLIDLIREVLGRHNHPPPVEAIVIGAPSIVDAQSGVLEWAPSFNWSHLPLKQIIEDEFRRPVYVENDVNLAVLGEFWKGAGKTASHNLVFVSIGTGIGAGIVINGELYRGATHAAGEVAYFISDVRVLRDEVGKVGSLENRVGSVGLVKSAQIVAQRYPASELADLFQQKSGQIHPREILAVAESGDPAALTVFNEVVDILTIVICNIAVLLDPEAIILGGPADFNWPHLIQAIYSRVGESLLRPVHLLPSELGHNALIVGGAYAALPFITGLRNLGKSSGALSR